MFSSIFVRKGKQKLQKRVLEINVHLPNLCLQKIIGFIENKNINESCLGKKRLHLSNNNKAVFAKNLMDYVNRVDWDVFPDDSNVDDDESLSNTIEDRFWCKKYFKNFSQERYPQNYFPTPQHYLIKGHIDILIISESKLDNSFPDG